MEDWGKRFFLVSTFVVICFQFELIGQSVFFP
jgi:hypothetical protein